MVHQQHQSHIKAIFGRSAKRQRMHFFFIGIHFGWEGHKISKQNKEKKR